jgi:hypothetical protein
MSLVYVSRFLSACLLFSLAGIGLALGSSGQAIPSTSGGGITLGTPVASTSGTAITFTGIPSGTKSISLSLVGVSTNGNENYYIQLGDAGGIETSGYLGAFSFINTGVSPVVTNLTAAFGISNGSGTNTILHGTAILTLENATSNTWTLNGSFSQSNGTALNPTSGSKSLSAVLDRITLTTATGIDTFDAGEVNIAYQ